MVDPTKPISPMGERWIMFWNKRLSEIWCTPEPNKDGRIANLASLVRNQDADAWSVISGKQHLFRVGDPTDDEREAVSEALSAWRGQHHAAPAQRAPGTGKAMADADLDAAYAANPRIRRPGARA